MLSFSRPFALHTHKASFTKVAAMASLWGEQGGGTQWGGGAVRG